MSIVPLVKTPVRVAVIGCGYWGKNLVRNFHELGALAAVSDANPQLAAEMTAKYNVPGLTFEEILKKPDIDAVVIATPAEHHARAAKQALLAGKHAFVEKPLAIRIEDGQELVHLQRQTNKVLMVGHLLHYHPIFEKLKAMCNNGELGRLRYAYSNRLNMGKIRREEDILWSFAPHDISMILSLFPAKPYDVQAHGGYYLHQSIADVTNTHLYFPGGEQAHVFVSWLHPYKQQQLVVVGEEAMAVFDDTGPWAEKLKIYPHKISWKQGMPIPLKTEGTYIVVEEDEPLRRECSHFLTCIQTNQTPITDGNEGLRVLEVLDWATRSLQRRKSETPVKETVSLKTFPGVFIHETSEVNPSAEIGEGTKIWHFSHIMEKSRVGRNCVIGQNAMVGRNVVIGDGCKIQNNVSIYDGVVLEKNVFCGPSCVFTNVNRPRAHIEKKSEFAKTLVKEGTTIGANATIVCGTTLGEYSFIAAGAVVTKDVAPHAMMAGNPARQIGWVSHAGEKLDDTLLCPREKRQYEIRNNHLYEVTDANRKKRSQKKVS